MVAMSVNMGWQEVVAEKRRVQGKAIAQFEASDGKSESATVDHSVDLTESVNDVDILRQIAHAELSCEALTTSRIEK